MRKVLSFSVFLVAGLVLSQSLPVLVGTEGIGAVRTVANILLYVCLSFIMINVGREFEVDKSRWKSYTQDYFMCLYCFHLSFGIVGKLGKRICY